MLNPPNEFLASVSRILLFRRCPIAYQRRYLLKEPETVDPYVELGRAFHAYAAAKETGAPTPPPPTLSADLQSHWHTMRAVFDAQHFDDTYLVGVEEPVQMTWHDGDTLVRFRGILDRLEINGDRALVIDRKTGWRVPNADELRDDLQLTAYGVLVCHKYPQVKVVEVQQTQYRYGGRAVTVAFTSQELEQFRLRMVVEVGKMLRTTEFLPGPACNICPPSVHIRAIQPYQQVQVHFAQDKSVLVEVATPSSPEEALGVAQGIKLAEQLATEGKKALARWAGEHGPVELGNGAYGHWGRERLECSDLEGYQQFLAEKQLPAWRYLRPDGVGVKSLLRQFPEASKFFVIQPGSEFGWRADAGKAKQKTEAAKEVINKPWIEG